MSAIVPSLGDSIRVARVTAADSSRTTQGVYPTALPEIWRRGEPVRDRFRTLVPGLLRLDTDCSVVGICSTLAGEGTTTVTAGLACALAETHARVVVIDAGRSRPAHTGDTWSAPQRQVETEDESLLDRIEIMRLDRGADHALRGDLRRVISDARRSARAVVVDLEPLGESAQALDLGDAVHGVYLVVEAERERREVIARSVQSLNRAGVTVAGVLLNKRPRRIPEFLYRWL